MTGVRVRDDRGALVPLVKRSAIGEGLSDFKRRELRSRVPIDRMKVLVIVLVGVAALMTARVAWQVIQGRPVFVGGGWHVARENLWVFVWIFTLVVNGARGSPNADYAARIVPQCLKWGVCASCGYTLRDAAAQEDGCVVCSECGAAWKRERVG